MEIHPDRTTFALSGKEDDVHHLDKKCPYYKDNHRLGAKTVHSTAKMAKPGMICELCKAGVELKPVFKNLEQLHRR